MSDDFADFLRARLDEDYEAVRVVVGVNVMAAYRRGEPVPRWVPSPNSDAGIWDTNGQPRVKFVWVRERDHILRHDPARVLAEVEAKRKILAAFEAAASDAVRNAVGLDAQDGLISGLTEVVKRLASVYSDHPGYREEWKP